LSQGAKSGKIGWQGRLLY